MAEYYFCFFFFFILTPPYSHNGNFFPLFHLHLFSFSLLFCSAMWKLFFIFGLSFPKRFSVIISFELFFIFNSVFRDVFSSHLQLSFLLFNFRRFRFVSVTIHIHFVSKISRVNDENWRGVEWVIDGFLHFNASLILFGSPKYYEHQQQWPSKVLIFQRKRAEADGNIY